MPIARVRLPDGRVARFNVPEGTTPEQVVAFAEQQGIGQPRGLLTRALDPAARGLASTAEGALRGLSGAESLARDIPASETISGKAAEAVKGSYSNIPQSEGTFENIQEAAGGALGYVMTSPVKGLGAGLGAIAGAGQQQQRIEEYERETGKKLSPGEKAQALATGGVIGLAEGVLPEVLAGRIKIPLPDALKGRVGAAAAGAAAEGPTEFAGNIAQDVTSQQFNPEQEIDVANAVESGGIGAAVGAGFGAIAGRRGGSSIPAEAPQGGVSAEELDRAAGQAEEAQKAATERMGEFDKEVGDLEATVTRLNNDLQNGNFPDSIRTLKEKNLKASYKRLEEIKTYVEASANPDDPESAQVAQEFLAKEAAAKAKQEKKDAAELKKTAKNIEVGDIEDVPQADVITDIPPVESPDLNVAGEPEVGTPVDETTGDAATNFAQDALNEDLMAGKVEPEVSLQEEPDTIVMEGGDLQEPSGEASRYLDEVLNGTTPAVEPGQVDVQEEVFAAESELPGTEVGGKGLVRPQVVNELQAEKQKLLGQYDSTTGIRERNAIDQRLQQIEQELAVQQPTAETEQVERNREDFLQESDALDLEYKGLVEQRKAIAKDLSKAKTPQLRKAIATRLEAIDNKIEAVVDMQVDRSGKNTALRGPTRTNPPQDVSISPENTTTPIAANAEGIESSFDKDLAMAVAKGDTISYLEQNAPEDYKAVLKQALKAIDLTKLNIHLNGTKTPKDIRAKFEKKGAVATVRFDENGNIDIYLNPPQGVSMEAVLHEIVHGATSYRLAAGRRADAPKELKEIVRKLDRVMDNVNLAAQRAVDAAKSDDSLLPKVLKDWNAGKTNSLLNVDELISWGMTDREFQDWLKTIPSGKNKSMWTKFTEAIADFLGISNTNALTDLMDGFHDLTNYDQQLFADYLRLTNAKTPAERDMINKEIADKSEDLYNAVTNTVFRSSADFLEQQNTPVLKQLGKAMRQKVDTQRQYLAMGSPKFKEGRDAVLKKSGEARQKDLADIAKYLEAYTFRNGDLKAMSQQMTPEARMYIKNTIEVLDQYGVAAEKAGVKVSRNGQIAPFKKMNQYYPLIVNHKYTDVLKKPNDHKKEVAEIKDWLVKHGKIKSAGKTEQQLMDETIAMLQTTNTAISKLDDFHGNLERSRTNILPPFVYDFTPESMQQYMRLASERLAQVKEFGQSIGQERNLFQKAMEDPKVKGSKMSDYVRKAGAQIYGIDLTNEQAISSTGWEQSKRILGTATTGMFLGAPNGSLNNLIGGAGNVLGFSNPVTFARAMVKPLKEYEADFKEGLAVGYITDDILSMHDVKTLMESGAKPIDYVERGVNKATDVLMKASGFRAAENAIRASASANIAKIQLRHALSWEANGKGKARLRVFKERLAREGIDWEKLKSENGVVAVDNETGKYVRKTVNLMQGSYDLDQIPLWVNSPNGRLLFKFMKFGTQQTRLFEREFISPIAEAYEGMKKGTHTPMDVGFRVMRAANFIGAGAAAGMGMNAVRFWSNPIASPIKAAHAISKGDVVGAVGAMGEAGLQATMVAGTLGLISLAGQGVKWLDDLLEDDVESEAKFGFPLFPATFGAAGALVDAVYNLGVALNSDDPQTDPLDTFIRELKDVSRYSKDISNWYNIAQNAVAPSYEESDALTRRSISKMDAIESQRHLQAWLEENDYVPNRPEGKEWYEFIVGDVTPSAKKNGALKNSINNAIAEGNAQEAKRLLEEAQAGIEDPKQRRYLKDSIVKSVKWRRPLNIKDATPEERLRLRNDFLKYMVDNYPEGYARRIAEAEDRYERIVKEAGLYEE